MLIKKVTCNCGHEVEALFEDDFINTPNSKGLILKIRENECDNCYYVKNNVKEFMLKYQVYKSDFSNYRTKLNSYDKTAKTIVVYVPRDDHRFIDPQ